MASGTLQRVAQADPKTMLKVVRYSYTWTSSVAKNGNLVIKASDFGISTPPGYSPVALCRYTSGTTNCAVNFINARATGESTAMRIKNLSESAQTNKTAIMEVLYVRSGFCG